MKTFLFLLFLLIPLHAGTREDRIKEAEAAEERRLDNKETIKLKLKISILNMSITKVKEEIDSIDLEIRLQRNKKVKNSFALEKSMALKRAELAKLSTELLITETQLKELYVELRKY